MGVGHLIYPTQGGEPKSLAGTARVDEVVHWSARSLEVLLHLASWRETDVSQGCTSLMRPFISSMEWSSWVLHYQFVNEQQA